MMMLCRTNCAAALTSLAVISLKCNGGDGLAFGNRPFIAGTGQLKLTKRSRNASSSIKMINIDDLATMMPLESMDPTVMTSSLSNILSASSVLLASSDPKLELEIMNDFSHVALDMSTLLNPNTVWLRLCNVVGRILIITSDYIQKGNTTPDEWVFQLAMLAISTRLFMSSALPLIFAVFSVSTLSVRDRRIYSLLFESVGLTVLQFKTLLASKTLEWIQFDPNESVELCGECMYFLYSGEATTHVIGKNEDAIITISHESNSNSNDAELGVGNRIFGDVQFAKALESSVYKNTMKSRKSDKKTKAQVASDSNSTSVAASKFVVGANGASMLRISTDKIIKLMKNDNELTSSIQRLVSLCMQEKLSRLLREGNVVQSSNTSLSGIPNSTQVIFML
ncbi:hypothetical protein ACHAXH_006153 [Discostella pseudostelligera]